MSKSADRPSGADLLFEIATEELPATQLADLLEGSAANPFAWHAEQALRARRLGFESVRVWVTPRRLVYFVAKLADRQSPKETLIKVMSREEAYGPDGAPTEKFLKILQFKNARIGQTVSGDHAGRPYVFIKKTEPARKTTAILPEVLEAIVRSAHLPKTMRWDLRWPDGSDFVFSRPVRSLLCFYGNQTLKNVKIAGIPVGASTRLFIKSRHEQIGVRTIGAYFDLLKKKGIVLDPVERKNRIRTALETSAKAAGVCLCADALLLNEVVYLTETPQVISGVFDNAFLELPLEVLTVSMARKQRLFGSVDSQGRLANRFFGVLDRSAGAAEQKLICGNFGTILKAKLQDSLFFYREDSKVSLEQRARALDGLVFVKNAGSMLRKSGRLAELSGHLAPALGFSDNDAAWLAEAARLSKADLLTQMVGEFPELQGVMGRYYAKAQGLPEEVALAIGQQYLPRTADDKLPHTRLGGALSLIDKADLIAACFCLGFEHSSSADPYALRRSAAAIAKITFDRHFDYSLRELMDRCQALLSGDLKYPPKKADSKAAAAAFIAERAKAVLAERGYSTDLIEAVFACGCDRLVRCAERLAAFQALIQTESFAKTCKVIQRTTNILKSVKEALPEEVNPDLFQEPLERELFQKFNESREAILKAKEAQDVKTATHLYAEAFFDILEEFFAKVFINAEDLGIRKNRFVLLTRIRSLYVDGMADLSYINNKNG